MAFQYTREMCYEIARDCKTSTDFKRKNASAYAKARIKGWLVDYGWFENGKKRPKKWNDEKCFAEARKYSRKVDFQRKSSGAYHYAETHNLLRRMAWFENCAINLEYGKIYCVYRYVFELESKKYVYIGLTLRPHIRDERHRKGDSSVYDFAQAHGLEIPDMEIIERNLTQVQAREKEDCYLEIYKASPDFVILNKAKTGRMVGSVGGMHRKWSKKTCRLEAVKYRTRAEFQHKNGPAYQAALNHGWLTDYDWMKPVRHAKWTKEAFLDEARKYTSKVEMSRKSTGAYLAARQNGWLHLCDWFEPGQGWNIEVSRKRRDSKKVYQFTLDKKLVREYENLAEAIRLSGVSNVRKCIIGERKQAGGFLWAYEDIAAER